MIHPDRLKELTEGAEREAEQTHPLDSQVTMKDGSVIPSRSATQGARYSACRAALLKSALRAEGLAEALGAIIDADVDSFRDGDGFTILVP